MATYPNGVDFSTFARGDGQSDLDPNFLPISGERAVLEHVARRLITPPGSWHDKNYGVDLRTFLNAAFENGDTAEIEAAARNEALEVEGVDDVTAEGFVDETARSVTLSLTVTLQDSDEAFRMVFSLSADTFPRVDFPS